MVARFEVWLTRFDLTQGAEIRKTRPAVIISPNEMNRNLRTVIICPLTSARRTWPSYVPVDFGGRRGNLVAHQIRAADRSRLVKRLGEISETEARKLSDVLQAMFRFEAD
jgi:mRNA interferase MazF